MRIHRNNAQSYLQSLADMFSADPSSFEHWRCLHVEHTENTPSEWYASTLQKMKTTYAKLDCDIVHCANNDIMIISRRLPDERLFELAKNLRPEAYMGKSRPALVLYSMLRDWRTLSTFLAEKIGEPQAME